MVVRWAIVETGSRILGHKKINDTKVSTSQPSWNLRSKTNADDKDNDENNDKKDNDKDTERDDSDQDGMDAETPLRRGRRRRRSSLISWDPSEIDISQNFNQDDVTRRAQYSSSSSMGSAHSLESHSVNFSEFDRYVTLLHNVRKRRRRQRRSSQDPKVDDTDTNDDSESASSDTDGDGEDNDDFSADFWSRVRQLLERGGGTPVGWGKQASREYNSGSRPVRVMTRKLSQAWWNKLERLWNLTPVNAAGLAMELSYNNDDDLRKILTELLHATRIGLLSLRWAPECTYCGAAVTSTLLEPPHIGALLETFIFSKACWSCGTPFSNPEQFLDEVIVTFVWNPQVVHVAVENEAIFTLSQASRGAIVCWAPIPPSYSDKHNVITVRCCIGCHAPRTNTDNTDNDDAEKEEAQDQTTSNEGKDAVERSTNQEEEEEEDDDRILPYALPKGQYRMRCAMSRTDALLLVRDNATEQDEPVLVRCRVSELRVDCTRPFDNNDDDDDDDNQGNKPNDETGFSPPLQQYSVQSCRCRRRRRRRRRPRQPWKCPPPQEIGQRDGGEESLQNKSKDEDKDEFYYLTFICKVIVVPHGKLVMDITPDTHSFFGLIIQQDLDDDVLFGVPPEERLPYLSATQLMHLELFTRFFGPQIVPKQQQQQQQRQEQRRRGRWKDKRFLRDSLTSSSSSSLSVGRVVLVFTDIVKSTDLFVTLGDREAWKVIKSHYKILFAAFARRGRVVKTIGDAVMASFTSGRQAVEAVAEALRQTSQLKVDIRVGIHAGPALVVTLNGIYDYMGQTVNVAARVQGQAQARECFVTTAVGAPQEDPDAHNALQDICNNRRCRRRWAGHTNHAVGIARYCNTDCRLWIPIRGRKRQ